MFKAILSNQIWNSVRDWKGWENSGPMKSVDAVVKEHRLFIVLVVFKKSQVIKRKTHKIHAWYIYYSATFYLLTISLRNVYLRFECFKESRYYTYIFHE